MDNEINSPNQQSHKTITSAAGVNVMVVDDDVICLSIVAGILRTWRYQGIKGRFYACFCLDHLLQCLF